MTDFECLTLHQMASMVPDSGIIVEVGSMFGRSSSVWAEAKPTATIICIDTFIETYCVKHDIPDKVCTKKKFPLNNTTYNLYQEFKKILNNIKILKLLEDTAQLKFNTLGKKLIYFFSMQAIVTPMIGITLNFFCLLLKQVA